MHRSSLSEALENQTLLRTKKVCVFLQTLFINIQIAQAYLKSDGKTRAFFGIKELLQFGYQYYVVIPGIVSFIFAVLVIKGTNQRSKKVAALLLSLLAIAIVFARIWRVFI